MRILWKTPSGGRAAIRDGSGSTSASGLDHWGTLEMGEQEPMLHDFTFTLRYSRRFVAEVALDRKLDTLLGPHAAAVEALSHPDERESGIRFSLFRVRVPQRGDGEIAAMIPAIGTDTRDRKANE